MKFKLKNLILLSVVLFFTATLTATDKIILKNGSKSAAVSKITDSGVIAGGQTIPLGNIKEIVFSATELPAKKSGVILKNGTLLSGIIRKLDKKEISFRSTTFGLMTIPIDQVAVLYFVGNDSAVKNLNRMQEFPAIMQSTGTQLNGKILWCDLKSAGILTASGLKKIPADKLGMVCYAKFENKTQVILRNGDTLAQPKKMDGTIFKYSYGDVPLRAIKYFYPKTTTSKNKIKKKTK